MAQLIRLQKFLAQAGVASRRACEELMLSGRVEVDGQVVTRLGTKIDPATAVVRVDGGRVSPVNELVYLMVNKPAGVVSTMADPQGRPDLNSLLSDRTERLFHVGRLDTATTGLLLVTNDGDFSQKMTHPSYEVKKTYVAEVEGDVGKAALRELSAGVSLDGVAVQVQQVRIRHRGQGQTILEMTIHEGRKHVVRRVLAQVGHPVRQLSRVAFGPLQLGSLQAGEYRELTRSEVGALLDSASL